MSSKDVNISTNDTSLWNLKYVNRAYLSYCEGRGRRTCSNQIYDVRFFNSLQVLQRRPVALGGGSLGGGRSGQLQWGLRTLRVKVSKETRASGTGPSRGVYSNTAISLLRRY